MAEKINEKSKESSPSMLSATKCAEFRIGHVLNHDEMLRDHTLAISKLSQSAVSLSIDRIAGRFHKNGMSDAMEAFTDKMRIMAENNPDSCINLIVDDMKISPWLEDVILGDEKSLLPVNRPKQLVDRLTDKDKTGNFTVGKETFLNFLEWFNYTRNHSRYEIKEQIDKFKVTYKNDLEKAVRDGWVPESVLNFNLKKLNQVEFAVDDTLALIEGDIGNSGPLATYNPTSKRVLFRPFAELFYTNFAHEATHVIEGGSEHYITHAMYKVFGDGNLGLNVNEAVTEHISCSLQCGDWDVIDPAKKPGSYSEQRLALNALCNAGLTKINIREFINAYFENDDDANRLGIKSARNKLSAHIINAFPELNIANS
jgi:hypothetical protein